MTQDEEPTTNGHTNGHLNGHVLNGHPKGPLTERDEDEEKTEENVFLFAPNLIGMLSSPD